jgi:hypothetical protein
MKTLAVAAILASAMSIGSHAVAATVVLPPAVPQPSKPGDVVGFVLQNPGTAAAAGEWVTFGQAFPPGAVLPTSTLYARDSDANRQVQMDVLATHPDGSVRFAAITTFNFTVAPGQSISGMLSLRPAYPDIRVDLAAMAPRLTVALAVTGSPIGAFTKTIDLGAALQTALASGKPDYWLHGQLATQVRVDVPVAASLHITADITGFANGQVLADVQFNNDLVMGAVGGSFKYSATVTLNHRTQKFANIAQDQYQDWHTQIPTGVLSMVNVQHDVAYLERSNAVLPYDLTTGVATTTLDGYATLAQQAGFGTPLAANGVTQYMPTTGGRGDIGYATQYNTVWLLTQDQRAATVGLAQGDTGGAVPWNMKLPNGHWLTPGDYPAIWSDSRGGPYSYTTGITQQTANTAWTAEAAHQPDLAYVPYLMTGSRWYLDRLNAQAAWDMTIDWPGYRCQPWGVACSASNDWHVVNFQDQLRQQAWSTREIVEAGWVGKPGSFEGGYFPQVAANNWLWLAAQAPTLQSAEGQAAGWLAASYEDSGATAPWQQDYFTGIVVLAARMGDPGAQKVLAWNENWVAQRFIGAGMNPHDGCTYNLMTFNPATNVPHATWDAIEQATSTAGLSNGTGWEQSNGDYCALARAGLGGVLSVQPTNSAAKQALAWLQNSGAPYIDQAYFQADPTWNVVPTK